MGSTRLSAVRSSGTVPAFPHSMRFLTLYLVGYFVLLLGAAWALWESGILDEIPGVWLAIGGTIAIGLGIMLAVASSPRAVTTMSTRDV